MEVAFLFGAGASFGSDVQGTPPLGPGLFDDLRRLRPDSWGTITGTLAEHFRSNFEDTLNEVPQTALGPLQRAMAAYFFEFTPRPSNLYVALARRIASLPGWSGAACTLNYERMLEMSFLAAGLRPFVAQPRTSATQVGFELCFPHGCCHWFCDADAIHARPGVYFRAMAVQFNTRRVSVISDPQQHRDRILHNAIPPVMSYFEPMKRTTAGHLFIEEQRARWRALALAAATIVIVGVRVRPHDEHVWAPVAASTARVVYCGGARGASEYQVWAATARTGRADLVLNGYFRDEFATICTEAGL
jgi:hypothetical protein